jgi:vancomycin resistance protein YoaR
MGLRKIHLWMAGLLCAILLTTVHASASVLNPAEWQETGHIYRAGLSYICDGIVEILQQVSEKLDQCLYPDLLGSCSTYGEGTEGRITNITLASQACRGVLLMPGEVFSFNQTVGERTEARGYQVATVYAGGVTTTGLGGGICQVSSTIFDAALYADLEIVERYNHSVTVDYLPLGLDAAVSWGTKDFQFRNNTGYPVLLTVTYEDGFIEAKIRGHKTNDNQVELSTVELDALTVETYRSHYDAGGNLLDTQQIAYSKYVTAGDAE